MYSLTTCTHMASSAQTVNAINITCTVLVSVCTILALGVFLGAAFYAQHHLSSAELRDLGLHHLVQ